MYMYMIVRVKYMHCYMYTVHTINCVTHTNVIILCTWAWNATFPLCGRYMVIIVFPWFHFLISNLPSIN